MATNFSIKRPVAKDPLRSYNFNVNITPPPGLATTYTELLTLRARSVTLPGRGNEPIEIPFGAMKSFFVGKPTFGNNQFTVVFQEYEDRVVSDFLSEWQEKIFSVEQGTSSVSTKVNTVSPSIQVEMLSFNGGSVNNGLVSFKNAWLQNVADITLDWSTSEGVTYEATFQFDYWEYA